MGLLADYLKSEEIQLAESAKQAGIIGHKATVGRNREDILADFLKKHIPARLSLHSNARIFSLDNKHSKEIDLLLINDISINLLNKHHMYTNIESIAAAITVKSYLDKASLYDCLENLASIPQMNELIISLHAPISDNIEYFIASFPTLFIFAYDGIKSDILQEHYNSFYIEHPDIPYNRRPRAIIVNEAYVLERFQEFTKRDISGNVVKSDKTELRIILEEHKGYPLSIMIREISDYVTWLTYIMIGIGTYFNMEYNI